jgi:hypothetical protein
MMGRMIQRAVRRIIVGEMVASVHNFKIKPRTNISGESGI